MPAPAGSNVGREGSITASIAELVTFESGHFSTKKAHFRPTLFTPEALLAMPLGGCAGFAGAAGLSCACARLPRRDDRQRAAFCPRARKRRQREYDVGFPQASGRPLHAGDSGSPGLSADPTGRPRRRRAAGGGDRRAAATRRPPRRAFVRRRDLAARGGAGGRPAVADRERAAGVRGGTWESGGRGVPGENAGRSRRAARLPRVLSAARGQLAEALRPPAGSARGRGAGGDGRALPHEAQIPLVELAAVQFPKLVVTGGPNP